MIIPLEELNAETLYALVEAFILREGTDYGESEVPLVQKVEQVIQQLKSNQAVILYSELHESVDIIDMQTYQAMQASESNNPS